MPGSHSKCYKKDDVKKASLGIIKTDAENQTSQSQPLQADDKSVGKDAEEKSSWFPAFESSCRHILVLIG